MFVLQQIFHISFTQKQANKPSKLLFLKHKSFFQLKRNSDIENKIKR